MKIHPKIPKLDLEGMKTTTNDLYKLAIAASFDNKDASQDNIDYALEINADINLADEKGRTILMLVSAYGDLEEVVKVLERNPNINLTCRAGKKALNYADERDDGSIKFDIQETLVYLTQPKASIICQALGSCFGLDECKNYQQK